MPCFGLDWVKRLGVNIAAFPALSKDPNDTCINLPEAIPRSEIAFDFSTLRLNVSLPQASMLNSARGYIPPEEWDEGIPPRWLTTALPAAAAVILTVISSVCSVV